MGSAPDTLEVVVLRVLGHNREEHGDWAVLLEAEMRGTVHEVCRLVFPTETAMAGLRKFVAEASAAHPVH